MNAILLIATLAALASGPLWYLLARRRLALLSFLDGFVLVSISGLVLVDVLPEALAEGGGWSLGFVALGLLGPTVLEHGLAQVRRGAHLAALGLAIVGLVLHSLGDGAALVAEGAQTHGALGLAIAIHSVPVGLVVWWLLYPVFGAWLPALALLAMCVGTVSGYVLGVSVAALLGTAGWAWFQALIAGSILHVIFGRPHLDEDAAHHHSKPPFEGLGNLCALVLLGLLASAHAGEEPDSPLALAALQLALAVAPALLLAYALIGLLAGCGRWHGRNTARGARLLASAGLALMLAVAAGRGDFGAIGMLAALTAALSAMHLLIAVPALRPGRFAGALHAGFVDAVDRGAPWIVAGVVLAALLLSRGGTTAPVAAAAGWPQWASLFAVGALYAFALLRRGGRSWLFELFGGGHAAGH